MAFDNNRVNNNINSFNLLRDMGYKPQAVPTDRTTVEGQNMAFNVDQNDIKLGVKIKHFEADLFDKTPQDPLTLTDIKNVGVNVKGGMAQVRDVDLTSTVTNIVKKETNNVVRNIDINFEPGNQIKAEVKGKKFIKFNLKVQGMAHPNPINNVVRFTPEKINVNGIPVKKIMDFFGFEIGEIIKFNNQKGSVFTSGDSIYFNPNKLVNGIDVNAPVTGIKTTAGTMTVMLGGETPETYVDKPVYGQNNYLTMRGGNVNFNGFNLLNTDLAMIDGTPQNDFDLVNDPSKKYITQGQVTIPEEFIATALKQKSEGGSMKDMTFSMPNGVGKLKAKMWGFLPVSLDLNFGNSSKGGLLITPDKGKVFGFIPLPDSMLRKTIMKETEGQIDGNGVTVDLGKLADLETSPFKNVRTENGKLILNL